MPKRDLRNMLMVGCVLTTLAAGTAAAEESENVDGYGSPNAVENTLVDDARLTGSVFGDRLVQPWFDWKAGLQERHGIGIGADYSSVFLKAS